MPVHDWSRVDAGTFHGFHTAWITHLSEALNGGLLPRGFYALPEQHGGRFIADVLTLHASPESKSEMELPASAGGLALAEAPPQAERRLTVSKAARSRRRTLTIRHISGHRIVALLEIISPANKDRPQHVEDFVTKVTAALAHGIHVTTADLFAPGKHDPAGVNGAIWQTLDESDEPFELPPDRSLALAAYVAGTSVEVYLKYPMIGCPLPTMPLFLTADRYIDLPLESSYQQAFRGLPEIWRATLETALPAAP